MRNKDTSYILDKLDQLNDRINGNLHRMKSQSTNKYKQFQASHQKDFITNRNYIRDIVQSELRSFFSSYEQDLEEIKNLKTITNKIVENSKALEKEITDNKIKISEIEYNLKCTIKDSIKESYNIFQNSLIDVNNFVNKDEFELKVKEIKKNILEQNENIKNKINQDLDSTLNKIKNYIQEINSLKLKYESIEYQFNLFKNDLNKIKINKEILNNQLTNIEKEISDSKKEINSKIEYFDEKVKEKYTPISIGHQLTNKMAKNYEKFDKKFDEINRKITEIESAILKKSVNIEEGNHNSNHINQRSNQSEISNNYKKENSDLNGSNIKKSGESQ